MKSRETRLAAVVDGDRDACGVNCSLDFNRTGALLGADLVTPVVLISTLASLVTLSVVISLL